MAVGKKNRIEKGGPSRNWRGRGTRNMSAVRDGRCCCAHPHPHPHPMTPFSSSFYSSSSSSTTTTTSTS
ncbi:hypothetical protein RJT34_23343 [Clitoria ternatea]|uniref:Uncharacterized protein n=1 Tax=Clitoria ternatea TaxID=43366 RepID=A0AAN9FNP4_CLITE